MVNIGNDWDEILAPQFSAEYYRNLREFLKEEYRAYTIYPDMYDIFNALKTTAFCDVKAVILGQDPYHGAGQAHGMCFSVKPGITPPPSLKNIFTELHSDLGIKIPNHGCLSSWAENGVLLLNTVLTVRAGQANSHKNRGWETLTSEIIRQLSLREKPVVFILWGGPARSKKPLIGRSHLVLEASHPTPLSAYNGFFGCKHFSKANNFLREKNLPEVDWSIADLHE
ncbi:MAG: uracil-DNA glycosylase [Ruminococcus sp.]|jgi:uracil-DNA glycosylase|nr:uracil-DNA glycosylase [Ruminococcus sp.]